MRNQNYINEEHGRLFSKNIVKVGLIYWPLHESRPVFQGHNNGGSKLQLLKKNKGELFSRQSPFSQISVEFETKTKM